MLASVCLVGVHLPRLGWQVRQVNGSFCSKKGLLSHSGHQLRARSFCLGPAGRLTAKWQGLVLGGAGRGAGVDRMEHGLSYQSA